MQNPTEARIADQKRIMDEGIEIEMGNPADLPLPLSELIAMSEDSEYVTEVRHGGLTAVVYGLEVAGKKYALQKKRPVAKVANFDGQASFLTEIQRRADFTRLKKDAKTAKLYENFIDTIYASYRNGIILSPWIENGRPIHTFDEETLESMHRNLHALDKAGLMEWDLCPGNVMETDKQVILFDFGYMWPYDPRHFYNSAGLEAPVFHSAERFETRSLCQHLMKLEREQSVEQAIALFRLEKQIALKYYRKRLDWLVDEHADAQITDWVQHFIDAWHTGLQSASALKDLYDRELFRSMVLDMHDDLIGHSCTVETLRKIDKVADMIRTRYADLIEWDSLLFDDAGLPQNELLKKYTVHRQQAEQWQL